MSLQTWKGGTLEAPIPAVLVSCGTMEQPNALTIAWTGIVNSEPPMTYISVRPSRYSYEIIRRSGEFVINLPTAAMTRAIDYCGVRSGREENKIEKTGLHLEAGETVRAPLIAESPIHLECRVCRELPLGTHTMFLAEITAVRIDEALLDTEGKLHIERAGLAAYAHGTYFALGKKLGTFGYSVRKKKRTRR